MIKAKLTGILLFLLAAPTLFALNIKDLENRYPLKIVTMRGVRDTWNGVKYETLEKEEMEGALPLVDAALGVYPVSLFSGISLKRIVLCKNLSFRGQARAAVPDNRTATLFISFDNYGDVYTVHFIIHEIHHYAEFALFGDYQYNWPEYKPLYEGGFTGGKNAREDDGVDYYSPDPGLSGFINRYSMTGPEEDRAEITAFYLNPLGDESRRFSEKCAKDPLLRKKTLLVLGLYESRLGFTGLTERFRTSVAKAEQTL